MNLQLITADAHSRVAAILHDPLQEEVPTNGRGDKESSSTQGMLARGAHRIAPHPGRGGELGLKCSQRFLTGKKTPVLTFNKCSCLARRVSGSDGLCAPLLSPQEGAAVVSGDAGEKAMAAIPLF